MHWYWLVDPVMNFMYQPGKIIDFFKTCLLLEILKSNYFLKEFEGTRLHKRGERMKGLTRLYVAFTQSNKGAIETQHL